MATMASIDKPSPAGFRHLNAGLSHLFFWKVLLVALFEAINNKKADLLYSEIDRNPLFKGFVADKEDRSTMNATFNLADGVDGSRFDSLWKEAGINGLNGHRSVGGYRASMYNALALESVHVLVEVMQEFERTA